MAEATGVVEEVEGAEVIEAVGVVEAVEVEVASAVHPVEEEALIKSRLNNSES